MADMYAPSNLVGELPFGIQQQYDMAVERTGTTPKLEIAKRRILYMIQIGPHQVEEHNRRTYSRLDGGVVSVVDNTEEVEYHGE